MGNDDSGSEDSLLVDGASSEEGEESVVESVVGGRVESELGGACALSLASSFMGRFSASRIGASPGGS